MENIKHGAIVAMDTVNNTEREIPVSVENISTKGYFLVRIGDALMHPKVAGDLGAAIMSAAHQAAALNTASRVAA